ncbi:Uncharacterized protein PBTT_01143 [Plasmodiophora brassicae]|uniref:Uncharacterized protein n=1 Tax=Plasmodiophora brassicae TaxID=37360 RepID=A0A0G4IZ08_PLABS|nr:hypothetical protein PBRA_001648 [Plasmodiophora brassicae]
MGECAPSGSPPSKGAKRPSTPEQLAEPSVVLRRADPHARLKKGIAVVTGAAQIKSFRSTRATHRRTSTNSSASGAGASRVKGQKAPALLGKYQALCETIKTKWGAILATLPKLLQHSADLFGELSTQPECDEAMQESLQDIVRLDCLSGKAMIDELQSRVDIQTTWLTMMCNQGYAHIGLGHIDQLERVVAEQDQLITSQRGWVQLMKTATDLTNSHSTFPKEGAALRWAWLQTRVKFGAFAPQKVSIRKRIQQIFFRRVKNIRRVKALRAAACRVNFSSEGTITA